MDNNYDSLQKKVQELFNPLNIFLALLEIIFLVFICIVFMNNLNEQNSSTEIEIRDFSVQNSIRDEVLIRGIEEVLYEAVSFDMDDSQNVSIYGAGVREGSLKSVYFEDISSNYESIIVDIPDVQGSYRIYYEKSDERTRNGALNERAAEVIVTCLSDYDEKIYDNYKCRDKFDGLGHGVIVQEYLNYNNFEDFYAYIDEGDLSKIKIVSRYYNHTAEQDAKYVEEVKKFVESLGISPELFEYYIVPVDELEIL